MNARRSSPARVLVVDDDVRYGEWLRHHLEVLCPQTSVSLLTRSEFERWCTKFSGRDCDLVLLAALFGEEWARPGIAHLVRERVVFGTPARQEPQLTGPQQAIAPG